jgi:rhodanese-related sulfurtransferase
MPLVACAVLASAALTGTAVAGDTPPTLNGAKSVDAAAVAKAQADGAVVVDTRVASEYADGHIKGAISVPYREKSEKSASFDSGQDEFNFAKLPSDKAAAIVVYCNGPECWKSFKASTVSIKAGYTNILWYREGFPDWKSKNMPVGTAE